MKNKTHFKTDAGVLCKPGNEFDRGHKQQSAGWLKTDKPEEVTCAKCLKVFEGYKKIR